MRLSIFFAQLLCCAIYIARGGWQLHKTSAVPEKDQSDCAWVAFHYFLIAALFLAVALNQLHKCR